MAPYIYIYIQDHSENTTKLLEPSTLTDQYIKLLMGT